MRRLALLSAVLGVVALAAAAVIGLVGVSTDVADRSYDCGAPIARLGGDDRETEWREYSFQLTADPEAGEVPPDELPQRACKEKTDDRLNLVYLLGGLGVALLLAAVVLWLLARRRPRDPGRDPGGAPVGSTSPTREDV
jgi:hypothetical protein